MTDVLSLLKANPSDVKLAAGDDTTEDFSTASDLVVGGQKFPLTTATNYVLQGEGVPLSEVYFAWVHRDLSRTDFLELADSKGVKALGFLQRADICDWLKGDKQEFEFNEKVEVEHAAVDDLLQRVLSQERHLVDHNTSLRGSKTVDFSNAAESCKRSYLQPPKSDKKHQTNTVTSHKRPQNPIILISPSASAVITMANIKSFLERGLYVNPQTSDPEQQEHLSSSDITMITHTFPTLGKVTFMCVDNTDKFSKEEHWDRTVAVFTTGQKWQFKNYKWSSPSELFRKVKGYYFHFEKEPIPQTCSEWNVELVGIDKHKRFKDAVVLNRFWDSVERAMTAKGWR